MERAGLKRFLMPSIGDVLFVSIFLRVLFLGGTLLNDGDTGWHLVAGEYILKTLSIPHTETYSHTVPGIDWISHEWLSEVLFALVHRAGRAERSCRFLGVHYSLYFLAGLQVNAGKGHKPAYSSLVYRIRCIRVGRQHACKAAYNLISADAVVLLDTRRLPAWPEG